MPARRHTRLASQSLEKDKELVTAAQPGKVQSKTRAGSGDGPHRVRGVPLHRKGRFAFPSEMAYGNPLTAGVSAPLRSETKGQAGACPDRTRAIPCNVPGTTMLLKRNCWQVL